MTEARPYASLSSGLLARKGAAKPAMRPQGFGQMGMGMEDLGWNDMGQSAPVHPVYAEPHEEHVPSSISALTPAPHPGESRRDEEREEEFDRAEPPVVGQQRAIAENFDREEEPPAPAPRARAEVVKLPARAPAASGGRKAAFTLRVDPERHLRLRLACAVSGRSAQQIVTEALDAWLKSIPEVETLAERAAGGQRS